LNELHTRDPEAAITFYAGLFGWETEVIEENGEPVYGSINNAGSLNGGLMPMTEEPGDAPSYWLPYFTVTSIEGAVAKVWDLGGKLMAGPLEVPAGRIAAVSDPQGAAFALFEGETDD
jgi:predicted enzyme related to lactoylglutathione lyase